MNFTDYPLGRWSNWQQSCFKPIQGTVFALVVFLQVPVRWSDTVYFNSLIKRFDCFSQQQPLFHPLNSSSTQSLVVSFLNTQKQTTATSSYYYWLQSLRCVQVQLFSGDTGDVRQHAAVFFCHCWYLNIVLLCLNPLTHFFLTANTPHTQTYLELACSMDVGHTRMQITKKPWYAGCQKNTKWIFKWDQYL